MSSKRRADLDALAYQLRVAGLTYQAIANRLGVSDDMARRRVMRHERTLREQAKRPPGTQMVSSVIPIAPGGRSERISG